jgi:hypothetical protein
MFDSMFDLNYENVFYAGCDGINFLDRASYKGDSTEILSNSIDFLNSCVCVCIYI